MKVRQTMLWRNQQPPKRFHGFQSSLPLNFFLTTNKNVSKIMIWLCYFPAQTLLPTHPIFTSRDVCLVWLKSNVCGVKPRPKAAAFLPPQNLEYLLSWTVPHSYPQSPGLISWVQIPCLPIILLGPDIMPTYCIQALTRNPLPKLRTMLRPPFVSRRFP